MLDLFCLDKYSIYCVEQDENQPYLFIVTVANKGFHFISETEFAVFAKLDCKNAWSIENDFCSLFESLLSNANIRYGKIDFIDKYREFLKERYDITEDIEKCDCFYVFGEEETNQIRGLPVTLYEGYVKGKAFSPKDKILFYVHSNEQCGHHCPHVHVKVRGKCENYCAIDLLNYHILSRDKKSNDSVINECVSKLKGLLPEAKKAWNECSKSLLIFKANQSGELTDDLEKRE
jgi:hypothetical protein